MRVIATAGHVDHGKSALVEWLTGVHPDRWDEERRRGLTIDLGFGHATLRRTGEPDGAGEPVSLIDVPGHVRFLRNMLAGIGGIDACVFVVAASEGWKPQSEEHLRILELLGVQHGVVALTKADLVDDEWLELQVMDVRDRLAGTFLADSPIVPVSVLARTGLTELTDAIVDLVRRSPGARDDGRPRLWIDRVFAAKGSGTVVTGTLTGGALHVDQHLHAGGRAVRVRGIQSHGTAHDRISPGTRVALNLAGVDHTDLQRGDAVIEQSRWRPTSRFDATLAVLTSLDHVVSRRGAYVAYIGSGEFPVKVRVLGSESIAPGAQGLVRLHLLGDAAVPLVPGDRYVLRESGRDETVGGGEVLDVAPVRPASKAAPTKSTDRLVAERGWVTVDELEALTGELRDATLGGWVVDPAALAATANEVRERIVAAGDLGLDLASLDERGRAVLSTFDDVKVEAGTVRLAAARDPFADHPFLEVARTGGVAPPEPTGIDPKQLRELVRRSRLVERDGLFFHPSAVDTAALAAARLLAASPDGFTVSEFREALSITRKHAVPLAAELDARGITRRRDDRRIAGPRLPGL